MSHEIAVQEEQIDIVSGSDEILRSCSKNLAHQEGLLHRCVVAQVIDSQGNWILVEQASDRQDAGQFVSPVGGHVRSGEAPHEALLREAFEELGISHFHDTFVGKAIYNREVIGRKENHFFYVYEIRCDENLILNHESVGSEKFSLHQLQHQLHSHPEKFGAAFHFVVENFYPQL